MESLEPGLLTSLHPSDPLLGHSTNGHGSFVSVTAEETVPDFHRFPVGTVGNAIRAVSFAPGSRLTCI